MHGHVADGRFTTSTVIALVALALVWGTGFLFIKNALTEGMSPGWLTAIRTASGALVAWVLVLVAERSSLRARLPDAIATPGRTMTLQVQLALGLFSVVPFWLLVWGEQFVTSSVAGILSSSDPLWTAAILAVVLRRVDRRATAWVGLLVGFGGVLLLLQSQGGTNVMAGGALGVLAVLASAILYAMLGVYVAMYVRGVSPLRVAAWGLTWGSLLVGAYLLVEQPAEGWSADAVKNALVLGVLDTAVGYALFYYLLDRVGPSRTALAVYLMPVVAVAAGFLVLGEAVTTTMLGAVALVLAGIWVAGCAPELAEPETQDQHGAVVDEPGPTAEADTNIDAPLEPVVPLHRGVRLAQEMPRPALVAVASLPAPEPLLRADLIEARRLLQRSLAAAERSEVALGDSALAGELARIASDVRLLRLRIALSDEGTPSQVPAVHPALVRHPRSELRAA